MTRQIFASLAGALAVLLAAGCGVSPNTTAAVTPSVTPTPSPSSTPVSVIAVIPQGTTRDYWNLVRIGATDATNNAHVRLKWKGPLHEDDRAGQIRIVQQFISDRVSGIVLAPTDNAALAGPVRAAAAKHIPVVIIDSPLKGTPGKDFVAFLATDNERAGELGGDRLAKLLGGQGKVVLLRYADGYPNTLAREAGFLAVMARNPGITVISDNEYGGTTQGESQTKAMQMIDTLKQADGIFCPNESTTLGMLHALIQNKLIGKVKFVGFDAAPPEVDALKAGQIQALVAQNPSKMGFDGVMAAVNTINGKAEPTTEDTGATVVDTSNLNSVDVHWMLHPN